MSRLFRFLSRRPAVEGIDAATALGERVWRWVREGAARVLAFMSGAGAAWWSALQVAAPGGRRGARLSGVARVEGLLAARGAV